LFHQGVRRGTRIDVVNGHRRRAVVTLGLAVLLDGTPVSGRPAAATSPPVVEGLGHGVVAIRQAEGRIFVGWRLLGLDADDIAFHVERKSSDGPFVRLNEQPIARSISFPEGGVETALALSYRVRPVVGADSAGTGPHLHAARRRAPATRDHHALAALVGWA
jgi:hypothetical protein